MRTRSGLTNTATSAARFYWENKFSVYNAADISIPAAVSVFPGEDYQASFGIPKIYLFKTTDAERRSIARLP
jgi:hypothetical protein